MATYENSNILRINEISLLLTTSVTSFSTLKSLSFSFSVFSLSTCDFNNNSPYSRKTCKEKKVKVIFNINAMVVNHSSFYFNLRFEKNPMKFACKKMFEHIHNLWKNSTNNIVVLIHMFFFIIISSGFSLNLRVGNYGD